MTAEKPAGSPASTSNTQTAHERVEELMGLLAQLFADPPSPELITIDNIRYRYRLTGFGPPALSAIEQTQRLSRTWRDYGQIGLCDFHIGLIYLYYEDPRAAAAQFGAARRSWTLEGDAAAICLSYYAQGIALRLAYHYETAMSQYSRAEKGFSRNLIGAQATRLADFGRDLVPLVRQEQQTLREIMWPPDSAPPDVRPAGGPPGDVPGNGGGPEDGSPGGGAAGAEPADARDSERASPSAKGSLAGGQPDGVPEGQPVSEVAWPAAGIAVVDGAQGAAGLPLVPVPVSRLPVPLDEGEVEDLASPVPGHRSVDDRYQWYTVHRRKDSHLPEFVEGTWLLVNRDAPPPGEQALVVVSSREPAIGSVLVRPGPGQVSATLCYLGYYLPGQDEPSLILDASGQALQIPHVLLLGVVVGAWHNILG